jgi:hypothetical protein
MANSDTQSVIVSRVSELRGMRKSSSQVQITPGNKIDPSRRKKVAVAAMHLKTASTGISAGAFGGGNVMGGATNVYSPHLSTDFLELPQNITEQRAYYRHFYNNDPYVGQAIDLHTELPLSKLRLALPKGKDPKRNREVLNFYKDMVERINLLQNLIDATREYYVIGEAFLFTEDTQVEVPEEIYHEYSYEITVEGEAVVHKKKRSNWKELEEEYVRKHYQGWKKMIVLPPDQVHLESFQFSDEDAIELIPDSRTASLVQRALQGDPIAAGQFSSIPEEIRQYLEQGLNIPLGTDPTQGSFVYHLARAKPSYQQHGVSLLQRCLRTLVYRDKLRQSQQSIASRAMTPKRLIYAEDLDVMDVEELRDQVDMALMDPDYSIITNYQVNWEEISANDRLLNLSGEFDITDRQLFAGLGVTESMLTGESNYSGERINIEIINNRYLLYRDLVERYVEEYLFKPVARKKGFVEQDEFGNEILLYPKLSFTRLAVRDNRDTFDSLFNLYQKGSLSVNYILELFNLDPDSVREQLEKDLFTVNDATFNEAIRSVLSEVGRMVPTHSDFPEQFIKYLSKASQFHINYKEPEEGSSRF